MVAGEAMICAVDGCELPAVRKVKTQTGGRVLARTDDGQGKIVQTTEITYSEHWYCENHALLIETGH